MNGIIAPGARIIVRDCEWLVQKSERALTGGQALWVIGISELVRDKEFVFLTKVEKNFGREIEILDPVETQLKQDTSSSFQASLLYMESLLRKKTPTNEHIYVGHQAAMDLVPYQLEPAIQSLKQPRQRILIADAVGLGKTLEAGILISELIRRGKGKRILVLTVKSMLTQFQKEMWIRFSIPLMRLDSVGIQRIRSRIPTNHNPFYYYDKAIISIDTLKQDAEYRTYIEDAKWDIIVIDEAHNVAQRGQSSSMRAKLAKLLSKCSDTLIMLSATPHDGKARSFASIMNMLDHTAIADPDNYGPEDIKGLYIRRFKKDIQNQVKTAFKEREIYEISFDASEAEEKVFEILTNLKFTRIDQHRSGGLLFKITLEKSLFSSPAACLQTIQNRIRQAEKNASSEFENDIRQLNELRECVEQISVSQFSKYQKLIQTLQDKKHGWTGKDTTDRLVIFTERIETLKFLQTHLQTDLKLKENQIQILHGSMSDVEQQGVVENFGKEDAPIRILIASDVASEGINLHYLSHRMIHFDIPWSLMVFQQRNGRIDRYGQEFIPQITYLITQSKNKKIRGDMRILELLIQKDKETTKNIGDPAVFMGVYDIDAEEQITAKAIENGQTPEMFETAVGQQNLNPLDILLGSEPPPTGNHAESMIKLLPSLFEDDFDYVKTALSFLNQIEPIEAEFYVNEKRLDLTMPEDLKSRFQLFPAEIMPKNDKMVLSANPSVICDEIKRCRKEENVFPGIHYLWSLNPVVEWINDKITAVFKRHEAPIFDIQTDASNHETIFIISGLIPNRKGQPLIYEWLGVNFKNNQFVKIEPFEEIIKRCQIGKQRFPNRQVPADIENLQKLLPEAVSHADKWMKTKRKEFEDRINVKLNEQYNALEKLKQKKQEQLELFFSNHPSDKKNKEQREIDNIFDEYLKWVEDTMTTEEKAFIQIVCVIKN